MYAHGDACTDTCFGSVCNVCVHVSELACTHACCLPILYSVLCQYFFFEVCFYIYISMWAYILVLPPTCVCVCTHTHTCLCVLHKLTWHSCMHIPGYMIVRNWPFVYFAGWIFIVCIISLPSHQKSLLLLLIFFSIIVFFFHILCFKLVALSYLILQSSVLSLF